MNFLIRYLINKKFKPMHRILEFKSKKNDSGNTVISDVKRRDNKKSFFISNYVFHI